MQKSEHPEDRLGRAGLLIFLGYVLALILHPSLLTDYFNKTKFPAEVSVTHELKR